MKICLLLCLAVVFGGFSPVFGQAPVAPHPHSLSVKVEPISSGSSTDISEKSRDSRPPLSARPYEVTEIHHNETETNKESESLQVSVRNFSPLPDSAQIEWYFVSAPEKPDNEKPLNEQQSIFDQGARSVELAPGGSATFPIESKDITSKIKRHTQGYMGNKGKIHQERRATSKKESGSKLSGWMVRVVADGKVIDASGSDEDLKAIAKDDAKFNILKGQ